MVFPSTTSCSATEPDHLREEVLKKDEETELKNNTQAAPNASIATKTTVTQTNTNAYGQPNPTPTKKQTARDIVQENTTYRDYAGVMEEEPPPGVISPSRVSMDRKFVEKLHYMLSDMEKNDLTHVANWQPHGRCFIVRQVHLFEEVLPLWFRQSKFASFQRQLNMYGFSRISSGMDKHAYYHELFLRGKPFLAKKIQRIKLKGKGHRKPSCAQSEPNFYQMTYLPASVESCEETTAKAPPLLFAPANSAAPIVATSPSMGGDNNVLASLLSALQQPQQQVAQYQHPAQPPSVQTTQPQQQALLAHYGLPMLFQQQPQQQQPTPEQQRALLHLIPAAALYPPQPAAPTPGFTTTAPAPQHPLAMIQDPQTLAGLAALLSLSSQQQTVPAPALQQQRMAPMPWQAAAPQPQSADATHQGMQQLFALLNSVSSSCQQQQQL